MKQLFSNNAATTLATSIGTSDTTIVVATGTGGLFPSPVVGQEYFLITLEISGTREIMRCISRTGDTLTVDQRGLEGTVASGFSVGSAVECRETAGTLASFAKYTDIMYKLDTVDMLTAPSTMTASSYICYSNDPVGNPIVAIRTLSNLWTFSTHSVATITGAVTSGTNTTTQLTSTNLGTSIVSPLGGEYLIQFTTGSQAGTVRAITSSGTNTVSWATALPSAPVVGDQFSIYRANSDAIGKVDVIQGAVVGTTDAQTLTNKTISAANNTIQVSATGVSSTTLNPALTEIAGAGVAMAIALG